MSAIIESVLVPSGISAYAVIRNNSGLVWNGSSFESYNSAHWSTYAITMTEQASSSYFNATFPSSIVAGKYSYVVHQGSPATLGDPAINSRTLDWDGTKAVYVGLVTFKLPCGTISDFYETTRTVN